jgi:hypothetical protein
MGFVVLQASSQKLVSSLDPIRILLLSKYLFELSKDYTSMKSQNLYVQTNAMAL